MSLLQEHIDYLKDNPKGYWFKRKLYGWGWTPAKPIGWLMLIVYVLVILKTLWQEGVFVSAVNKQQVIVIAVSTILFLLIIWKTGESPRWQWGSKSLNEK